MDNENESYRTENGTPIFKQAIIRAFPSIHFRTSGNIICDQGESLFDVVETFGLTETIPSNHLGRSYEKTRLLMWKSQVVGWRGLRFHVHHSCRERVR